MTPDRQPSNTERAVAQLRRLIFSGELAAGSDHLETELAAMLGMSRTPVREAALRLEAQGLVEVRPRKGLRILPVSVEDMAEIYDLLTELESLAAERAAMRHPSEAELEPLAAAIIDMETALAREDREAWAAADDRFHRELVALSGNRRLASIANMMVDQVRRARAVTLHIRPLPVDSNADHRAVFEAIRAGDTAQARGRHRAHRSAAKSLMTDLLRKHGLRRL